MPLPRWLVPAALVIIALGIGDTVYLTIAHYTTPVLLSCPDTGIINCAKVTTSSYSKILGIPVALLGLIFFLGNLPLHLPAAWRSPSVLVRRLRLAASASGILMVFWLLYVELFRLNAICLYCSTAHVLTLLLFIVTVFGTVLTSQG
ncbi:MAG TPA: vitamin K epoxide reductase family protein [Candidatus Saccharimonadales bacterium]|nr:vitamin K epoxide reductase family protein [Candidatus Saccharimonadales bacterium]